MYIYILCIYIYIYTYYANQPMGCPVYFANPHVFSGGPAAVLSFDAAAGDSILGRSMVPCAVDGLAERYFNGEFMDIITG